MNDYKMFQFVSSKPEQRRDELLFVTRSFVEQYGMPGELRTSFEPDGELLQAWRAEFPDVAIAHDTRGSMRDSFMLQLPAKKPRRHIAHNVLRAPQPQVEPPPLPDPEPEPEPELDEVTREEALRFLVELYLPRFPMSLQQWERLTNQWGGGANPGGMWMGDPKGVKVFSVGKRPCDHRFKWKEVYAVCTSNAMQAPLL